uniref:B box-type domain-containing protein n=1 Tax=Phytophthora ramorum TaxID=164328 RepID=H3HD90_PHYRM
MCSSTTSAYSAAKRHSQASKRRETSVILIQKLVRQYEAQHIARLFREALNIVQAGYDRLAREDHAAVYLQRRYRGYATRMAYWVHRLQVDEHRRLQSKKAVVIQSAARRWLAKRYVRRVREQRRLAELKEAYIRERKRKEEERLWKERYDREQMELCVQRAQEAANQLREARREADLARVKAEAAEYRAKELAAEREIETLLKTPTTKKPATNGGDGKHVEEEEEKDPWMQLTDEYGNESSWDPPPPRTKKVKTSPEEEEGKDVPSEEEKNAPTEEEKDVPSEGDKSAEEGKPKEIDPLEEVLREGKCIKCQLVPSTKRCLDCKDTKRAFYCTACFREHTRSPTEENSSIPSNVKHDFEVVPRAAVARCESGMECRVDEDNPSRDQAASTANHASPMTTRRLRSSDMWIKPCAFVAELCCAVTVDTFSLKRRSMQHTWTVLDVLRDLLERETDRFCVECDVRASSRLCNLCGDGFCDGCFDRTHAKGAKRRHTWLPWDEKATVYFNVETKESTSERPNVLLSGEERHRLELAEREQLQRRRQVELESEVVKLKEQLRGLQAQDRPASPARTPTANSDDSRPNAKRQRIAEDLAERVRAEKHPVGSPVFQQAMIHELAVLAVTSPQLNKPK